MVSFAKRNIKAVSAYTAITSVTSLGIWELWSRKCIFESLTPETDQLFQSSYFQKYNPSKNPSLLEDSCVRVVPLSMIKLQLLEDTQNGGTKLIEAFCAGIWGGYGKVLSIAALGGCLNYSDVSLFKYQVMKSNEGYLTRFTKATLRLIRYGKRMRYYKANTKRVNIHLLYRYDDRRAHTICFGTQGRLSQTIL